jgi:hypothetical protein
MFVNSITQLQHFAKYRSSSSSNNNNGSAVSASYNAIARTPGISVPVSTCAVHMSSHVYLCQHSTGSYVC